MSQHIRRVRIGFTFGDEALRGGTLDGLRDLRHSSVSVRDVKRRRRTSSYRLVGRLPSSSRKIYANGLRSQGAGSHTFCCESRMLHKVIAWLGEHLESVFGRARSRAGRRLSGRRSSQAYCIVRDNLQSKYTPNTRFISVASAMCLSIYRRGI